MSDSIPSSSTSSSSHTTLHTLDPLPSIASSQPSSSKEPHYSLSPSGPHVDPTYHRTPLDPLPAPDPPLSLRDTPGPDLLPHSRPTLASFRAAEGPLVRSGKLRSLWDSLPPLPSLGDGPTQTEKMQLPGQDTMTALSPERADRLRRLYEEELVKRCSEDRPNASLWGGADDLEPDIKRLPGSGITWQSFRWVIFEASD
jgi:solute carrier family 25 phosphate transporter 23/24/25/41